MDCEYCEADRPRIGTANIIEIGYTSEGRYHEKLAEMQEQHAQLVTLLESQGYQVETNTIVLGSSGGIFKSTTEALENLGVEFNRRKKLLQRLYMALSGYTPLSKRGDSLRTKSTHSDGTARRSLPTDDPPTFLQGESYPQR